LQQVFAILRVVDNAAEPADALASDLDRGRASFADALRSGDAAGASSLYADDATLVAPAGELLHGRAAIEGFWRTGLEIGIADARFSVLEVERRGDVAFEVGEYALVSMHESGTGAVNRGRYLIVHRIEPDGRWRRAAEMLSPDPAEAPLRRSAAESPAGA
jgi:uncharacterized protein (TIGR02246 family)